MRLAPAVLLVTLCASTDATLCAQRTLTTLFAQNNGGAAGWVNMFDLTVQTAGAVTITAIDINTSLGVGLPVNCDVYLAQNTYVGNELNPAAWTLVSSGAGVSAGQNQPTNVDVADFGLGPGPHGFAVHYLDASPKYTNGNGSNQTYQNSDLLLVTGASVAGFFTGSLFTPRVWNGTIHYNPNGAAGTARFGLGCAGSNGTPRLDAMTGSLPKLGGTFTLELQNAPLPTTAVILVLGGSNTQWHGIPLPFDLGPLGAPGCRVLCSVLVDSGSVANNGVAQFPIAVPSGAHLTGAAIYCQGVVFDLGINALNLTTSNGLTAWLGM